MFYAHTVLIVPFAMASGLVAFLALVQGRLDGKRIWRIGLAASLFALLSVPFLIPLMQTRGLAQGELDGGAGFAGGIKYMIMDLFSDRVYRHHFDRRFLYQFSLLAGGAGSLLVMRGRRQCPLLPLGMGAAVCLLIAYGFPIAGVGSALQPYRFLVPAILLLLPLVTFGCIEFTNWFRKADPSSKGWAALLLLLLLPHLSGYIIDQSWGQSRLSTSIVFDPVMQRMESLPGPGRILIDDIPVGMLAPHMLRRPILGGLSTMAFIPHGFAGIDDRGIVFGRPSEAWAAEDLAHYLRLYGVQYVVFRRDALIAGILTAEGTEDTEADARFV